MSADSSTCFGELMFELSFLEVSSSLVGCPELGRASGESNEAEMFEDVSSEVLLRGSSSDSRGMAVESTTGLLADIAPGSRPRVLKFRQTAPKPSLRSIESS